MKLELAVSCFILFLVEKRGGTPPPVFLRKSSESYEKKRVEFCESARKCKKVQKSAEEYEKAEVRCWRFEVGRENEKADPLYTPVFS
jgi:hypothetical protein